MPAEEDKLLRQLNTSRPAALILGCERAHGLAFVRSLGRKGIPVIAVDAKRGPGMRSRYGINTLVPEAELLQFLERLGERLPAKGVMIPTDDAHVLFVSKNRSGLGKHFNFMLTEETALERLANKRSQYEYAASVGVPIPKTYPLEGVDSAEKLSRSVAFPCIIKPVYSHLWSEYRQSAGVEGCCKVAYVESPQELVISHRKMAQSGVELVVQEIIEGGDDRLYALYAYLDRKSEPLALLVRKKLRQWPVEYGTGSHSVSAHEPAVVEQGLKLLQGIGYRGLANIEFKKDPKDGQFKLIEFNVRSAIQIALAIDSGVDIPYIAYRDISGESVEPVDSYQEGVRWVDFGADLGSFLHSYRMGRLGFWSWARSVAESKSHAYFAWDDPLPSLARAAEVLKDGLKRRKPSTFLNN